MNARTTVAEATAADGAAVRLHRTDYAFFARVLWTVEVIRDGIAEERVCLFESDARRLYDRARGCA